MEVIARFEEELGGLVAVADRMEARKSAAELLSMWDELWLLLDRVGADVHMVIVPEYQEYLDLVMQMEDMIHELKYVAQWNDIDPELILGITTLWDDIKDRLRKCALGE